METKKVRATHDLPTRAIEPATVVRDAACERQLSTDGATCAQSPISETTSRAAAHDQEAAGAARTTDTPSTSAASPRQARTGGTRAAARPAGPVRGRGQMVFAAV